MHKKIIEKAEINDFNTDGSGFTIFNGKKCHIWNALPQEIVEFEIIKKNKSKIEGLAVNILKKFDDRIEPIEKDFVSSSPWQILPKEKELFYKTEITKNVFAEHEEILKNLSRKNIETGNTEIHYRHKMEYHIYTDENNNFSLGIFGRTEKKKIPIPPSILATEPLNKCATKIISWLDKVKFPRPLMKTIIIRSNRKGETIAGLFVKTEEIQGLLPNPFENLSIYYSEPKSPASVVTKTLHEAKQNTLTENLNGINFRFGLMSFFQINPDIFEITLKDIENFIDLNESVVDFYSGVGTIGLSLHKKTKEIILVEENTDAVKFAKQNIETNHIKNAIAFLGQAHTLLEHIYSEKTLIVDPPRGGLHPKVIKKILEKIPPKIIYLSCNIESQKRDLDELLKKYEVIYTKLYNFFPKTPHIESLIVLKKRL